VLFEGEIVEEGPIDELFDNPQHWYTKRLIESVPTSG
jgi:oligopeptide/dipeptide ABC transporter ATP-binding protein